MTHDTWNPDALRTLLSAYAPYAGAGTVELQEVDDGTSLQLTHERLPTPEAVEAHLGGWVNILARLEHLLDEAG